MTSSTPAARRLSRAAGDGRRAAPVRQVHLGLGNFFRAHQAWYTELAPDCAEWGIAGFTGRSSALADRLAAQDGLYTLVTRGRRDDHLAVISSVTAAHPGSDQATLLQYLVDPQTSVVTLTVTEAGYRRAGADLDLADADVMADVRGLTADPTFPATTTIGRLAGGLAARRAADAGPISIVSCDNIPENGRTTGRLLAQFAAQVDTSLASWIDDSAAFVDTVVDRITPRLAAAELQAAIAPAGRLDDVPVVTEPFTEWVLAGAFPAGRPDWGTAGAVFTDDISAFEHRKLWLLNGGHSLLAYAGSIRGHRTVAQAINDPVCRGWLEAWWNEAQRHLPLPPATLSDYIAALVDRFGNHRIAHLLEQIATDGSQKLPIRIVPVLRSERHLGRMPHGAVTAIAAWLTHLRGAGAPVTDVRAAQLSELAGGPLGQAAQRIIAVLAPDLADDSDLREAVGATAAELCAL